MIERIVGPGDPRIALYRDLTDPELLTSHGLFVAEGRLVVQRVLDDRRPAIRSLLLNEASFRALAPALPSDDDALPIYVANTDEFRAITGHHIHRGCLALVERPAPRTAEELCRSWGPASAGPADGPPDLRLPSGHPGRQSRGEGGHDDNSVVIVLEGVGNPDNVGGVFRNAAAFGAGGVLLSPTTCDPLYRKAIRTSMAATLRVPFARVTPWPAGLDQLRACGFSVVALTPREPSVPLSTFARNPHPDRIALLVGTEGDGLSAAVDTFADTRVRIPISGAVDSLNLAVAVGIALHTLRALS